MKNKKHWLTQDWAKGAILGAILCAILSIPASMVNDYLKNKPMLSTLWQIVKVIWNFIIFILTFNLKLWWIVVGIIVIFVIVYLLAKFKKGVKSPTPEFCNYTEDKFTHLKWSWKWERSEDEKGWSITDLKAHCPGCDTPMMDDINFLGASIVCPRCSFKPRDDECDNPQKIERIIHDNVRRNIRLS